MIPYNKPHITGKEAQYIREVLDSGKLSGDGTFTHKCQHFFEERYGFHKCLLTASCADALEMAALLLNIQPGDEVIIPSFGFVSTVNAFALRGAKIVFADSNANNPNIDTALIEALITSKTKAIVVVHYAGISCDMDAVKIIADKHGIYLVENAAQAVDSFYNKKPLGSIGHLGTFSFHETMNLQCGEAGMLVVNDDSLAERAAILWDNGVNKHIVYRKQADKYNWVDLGSSYQATEITAAFLYAQLENAENILMRKRHLWQYYYNALSPLQTEGILQLPYLPGYATNNGHMFYIVCRNVQERQELISALKARDIHAVFHYQSLHNSTYYKPRHDGRALPQSDRYSDCLLRLPFYYDLEELQIDRIAAIVTNPL